MQHLRAIRKVLAFVCCAGVSVGVITGVSSKDAPKTAARTIAEIQEERKANEEKIAALESQINALQGDINAEKQQQAYLEEQTQIIQQNINLLNAELQSIGDDIAKTEANIASLDMDIQNQQDSIDQNIELFKKRLCAMYMNGNDTSASIVLGSSSFYDMMSRIQMINSIAEHDDKLINDILSEIDALEQSKKSMESEKQQLGMKLDVQEARKAEKTKEIEALNEKMQYTQYEIDRIAKEQDSLARDKAVLEQENAAKDAEIDEIKAEVARQQAAAQAAWEAEQRKKYEQQYGGGGVDNTNYGPTYIPPTVLASGFSWPAPGFSYITSRFGPRWGRNHNGIDVGDGGISGGAATAAQSGTVVTVSNTCTHNFPKDYSCGCGGGYGNYVVISHDGTYSTLYGHLTAAYVSVGQYVSQGEVIGAIGCTGHSTGAHLHFEVWANGYAQDPLMFVSP